MEQTDRPFNLVRGDRRAEVAPTLAGNVPQSLGVLDQIGLWGNLGVSLLGFTGAIFVLQPGGPGTARLSLAAALTAIVAGTVLGSLAVAVAGLPGARTGAPAMVLLRGLFGARLSYLPTLLNIVQCLGWGTFELVTISTAAHTVAPGRQPPPARLHPRHLVGLLGGDRHHGGRRRVLGAAGRRLHPRRLWDRRVLAGAIGAATTGLALGANISDYENFLLLIGSVFVPLFAVLLVDFFAISGGQWDLSPRARSRWAMVGPWALGFVVYQAINPGSLSWWASAWRWIDARAGFPAGGVDERVDLLVRDRRRRGRGPGEGRRPPPPVAALGAAMVGRDGAVRPRRSTPAPGRAGSG